MVWSEPLHSRRSTSIKTMDREAGVRLCSQFHSAKQVQGVSPKKVLQRTHTCMFPDTRDCHLLSSTLWKHCMSFSSSEENALYLQGLCVLCVCVRERVPQSRALLQWQKFNPCGFLGLSLNKEASRSVVNQVFTRLEPLSNKNLCPRRTTEEEKPLAPALPPRCETFLRGRRGLTVAPGRCFGLILAFDKKKKKKISLAPACGPSLIWWRFLPDRR